MQETWPPLPYEEWKDTCATLHLWTQIVGKIRLACSPWTNHSWHVALYVTSRGLTTSPIPYQDRIFQIDFDFVRHRLQIETSLGEQRDIPLKPKTVAAFYSEVLGSLHDLGIDVRIVKIPNEISDPIPFDQDTTHSSYDAEYAGRFWMILTEVDRVMKDFRSRFVGKVSPVHFFWGSFDLAVSRFSGRRAPEHPGGFPHIPDWVMREAYSHEVSSAGFWPGNDQAPNPVFYSYAYPEPAGYGAVPVKPAQAFYSEEMGEFFLPYDAMRTVTSPDKALMDFFQSAYEAAANAGNWNREELEGLAYTAAGSQVDKG
jgi:hypothetical protein